MIIKIIVVIIIISELIISDGLFRLHDLVYKIYP